MQSKRKKRTRIRAAKVTAGHGHKKKNRGAGHRGGRGKSGAGKRGDFKLMKLTQGVRNLGKQGFKSQKSKSKIINLSELQNKISKYSSKVEKNTYFVDLKKQGYDKLLSKGSVNLKLNIKVDKVTPLAIKKIEKAGGKVE
jgi:large subunit ribosomal protein L15